MSADVNNRGAAALRRYRADPQVIAVLKAKVRDAVLRDCQAKEVGVITGISPSNACKWAHALGFRCMYVTGEERAHLMARRKRVDDLEKARAA